MDDEVEILEPDSASTTIFASPSSNPRHWGAEAAGEGCSTRRESLNPSQGMDLICNCDESRLIAYLKSVVERKDFASVMKTLRGRELRFKEELESVREAEGKKFSKLREEWEGLKVTHRETESQLEDLKKRFEFLSKFYRGEISEGLNLKNKSTHVREVETPGRGQAEAGMGTPLMEIATPKCLEKRVETGKECCRVKRTLDFGNEDNTEIQGRKQDRIPHASDLPISSVNRALSPHCSVHIVSNGLGLGVSEADGLGNNEIEEKYLNRQTDPEAIRKRNEDESITYADLGASCHSSKDEPPKGGLQSSISARKIDMEGGVDVLGASYNSSKDEPPKGGLQCSIPARKIDMEGGVDVGTALRNDVVILSDSESESSGPSLRKKKPSPCSKNGTCSLKKQNIVVDLQCGVKIEGDSDDGGKYSDQNEGQPMGRGAKRRCHMTVTSDSESDGSDVGFSCKRRKPRSGNFQTQAICEATASVNVQCEVSSKGPKEDVAIDVPHETYECGELDRNMGKEDSLSCEEVETVPDMKLKKRIRKTKDVKELLTVEHCDGHTDEGQGEASPGSRFRSLKRVIGENELPNTGQLDKGTCPDKRAQATKYKRLKRGGGEADGAEKSNAGKVPEKNTLGSYINDVNDGKSSIGGSTFASKGKSDGATKVAEGPSDSPIYAQNKRMLRSHSRKMINLTKESDVEDEDENDSQIDDDLGDFIVDSSESEKDSECADGNKSDSESSSNNSDSEAESNPSSADDLHEVIRKLSRQRERKLDWKYEGEMLAAFGKDDALCMRAVCALNRQQTNDERLGKSSFYLNRRGFDKINASRGSLLAEFLTDNDPSGPMKKSLQELQKHDSKGAHYCKDLASRHSKQLFEIYRNKEDPHFPQR